MKTYRSYLLLAAAIAPLALVPVFSNPVRVDAQGNGNGPAFPDPAALRPFQLRLCDANGIQGCETNGQTNQFTVPVTSKDGKAVLRLVIDYVSGDCLMGSNGVATKLLLETVADGTFATHSFVPVTTVSAEAVMAQATRLYADPGSTVRFAGVVVNDHHICRTTVSGHLAIQ